MKEMDWIDGWTLMILGNSIHPSFGFAFAFV